MTSWTMRLMQAGARTAALTWPVAGRLFREKLAIDENRAVWVDPTADYRPRPKLQGDIQADVAIIGGGFTGTSTAYYLSRRFPNKRIVLLEAATMANGASGRNGGLMLNWVGGWEHTTPELARQLYDITHQGIEDICALIERHQLAVSYRRDGTLTIYTDSARAEAAHAEVEQLNGVGVPLEFWDSGHLQQKLAANHAHGAIYEPGTGQINGAQLVRGLVPVLEAQGVAIYEHSAVQRIEEGATIRLTTAEGSVQAKAIVLATNGYTSKLGYFRDALFPLHSHVFATQPLSPAEQAQLGWHGTAGFADDMDRISYASLTNEGRIVFGGGSNQSYDYLFNNKTAYPGLSHRAHRTMEATLQRYFPASAAVPITHRWAGTLGITFDRKPLIGVRGEHRNVYYGLGYCGHGVTMANLAGQILADLYAGDDGRWRGLPFIQGGYQPIPPEPFRWLGYQLFTRLTGQSPRV